MAKLSNTPLVFTSAFGPRVPIKTNAGWTPNFHWGGDYGPVVRNTPGILLNAVIAGNVLRMKDQYGALGVRVTATKPAQDLIALLKRLYGLSAATVAFDVWHLASYSGSGNGPWANEGDGIGIMGSTGLSTGIHTHVELRINGQRVDPKPFLDAQASKAIAPAPADYYGDEFLMGLSQYDQELTKNVAVESVEILRRLATLLEGDVKKALIAETKDGKYYKTDAAISVMRDELRPVLDAIHNQVVPANELQWRAVDVIVSHVTATLTEVRALAKEAGVEVDYKALAAELKAAGIGVDVDTILSEMGGRLLEKPKS